MTNKLKCIVCGYERGGTTMLSEILRNSPVIDGKFECGMFLYDSPRDFILNDSPHRTIFVQEWLGSDLQIALGICDTDDFNEACSRLHVQMGYPEGVGLYFKCPAYMENLSSVMSKCDVPCVVTIRDPRGVYASRKRRNTDCNVSAFCEAYCSYARGLKESQGVYGDRILVIQHEEFCENPIGIGKEIFEFCGLGFDESYVTGFQPDRNQYSARGERPDLSECGWETELDQHEIDTIHSEVPDDFFHRF